LARVSFVLPEVRAHFFETHAVPAFGVDACLDTTVKCSG
jgi:hypothetical protein